MKNIELLINDLHKINDELLDKDNIIMNTNKLLIVIKKLLNDSEFLSNNILKTKYHEDINKIIKNIEQKSYNVYIEPQMKINNNKKVIDSDSINAPIVLDIYKPKVDNKIKLKKSAQNIINVYSIKINNILYYIDAKSYNIYDINEIIVGKLNIDDITINNIKYQLKYYTNNDFDIYKHITPNHILVL